MLQRYTVHKGIFTDAKTLDIGSQIRNKPEDMLVVLTLLHER